MEPFWFGFLIPCFPTSYQTACSLSLLLFSSYIFISFILTLCSVPGGFAWKDYPHNPKNQLKGPKLISYPFLGFIPQMGPLAHRKLASMASSLQATRLMAISLGSTRMVISSNPETAKEILCGSAFCDRPLRESTRLLMFGRAIGFAPSGSHWRHLRRMASIHMFSPKRVGGLEGVRQVVADEMIRRVGVEMEERGGVELRGILQKASLENVLESVFGVRGGGFGEEMGVMVKQGYEVLGEFNWGDYFPLGFMDFFGVRRRCHKLAGEVSEVVSQIIEQRRKDGDFNMRSDFLSALLSLPQQDLLTDADMVAVLWVYINFNFFISL